jgi:hypothetical protein
MHVANVLHALQTYFINCCVMTVFNKEICVVSTTRCIHRKLYMFLTFEVPTLPGSTEVGHEVSAFVLQTSLIFCDPSTASNEMCIEPDLWKLQQEWQGRGTVPPTSWTGRQELPIVPGAELQVKKGLSLLDAWKWFLEIKPRTGNQSYSSLLHHPQGLDAGTQTLTILSRSSSRSQSTSSRAAFLNQTATPCASPILVPFWCQDRLIWRHDQGWLQWVLTW